MRYHVLYLSSNLSTSCSKLFNLIKLSKSDLLQLAIFRLVETLAARLAQRVLALTYNNSVDNFQQTCRQQAVSSHVNVS